MQNNNKRQNISSDLMPHYKLPPQAIDVEEVILGAIMLENNSLMNVIDILKPEMFYKKSHQKIYQSILLLYNDLDGTDIVSITNKLRLTGDLDVIGGPYYIAQLTNRITSSSNIEKHARIVLQKYIQREIIRIGTQVVQDAYEDTTDVLELLENFEKSVLEINNATIKKPFVHVSVVAFNAFNEILKAKENKGQLYGITTGFSKLDSITNGWQKQDLIIIAARPSMGKSALAVQIATNACKSNYPIAIFSLEMSATSLVTRMLSSETKINNNKIKSGNIDSLDIENLKKHNNKICELPLYIDETPGISLFELRTKARRLKHKYNIQAIFIDYLQLMNPEKERNKNREQEISGLSFGLKALAKELDIPIIVLSQLSRKVEERGNKRPLLSDLRESGAIEQDADLVIFIYREQYYVKELEEDIAEIILAKHRNGATDTVSLNFLKTFTKFEELDYSNEAMLNPIIKRQYKDENLEF